MIKEAIDKQDLLDNVKRSIILGGDFNTPTASLNELEDDTWLGQ